MSSSNSTESSNIISIRDVRREERKTGNQPKWNTEIEGQIRSSIRAALSGPTESIFTRVCERFEAFYERPSTNMLTLRRSTRGEKGQWWEHFCLMYLREKGYATEGSWLLGDVPEDILEDLQLDRRDLGIDIVIQHENGFFAVQAKWRNSRKKLRTQLTWKQLSTFYALSARTGPWLKQIVMTNCNSVRRAGKKWKMDQTIAKGTFEGLSREFWQSLAGLKAGHNLTEAETKNESESSSLIRNDVQLRQAWLDRISLTSKKV